MAGAPSWGPAQCNGSSQYSIAVPFYPFRRACPYHTIHNGIPALHNSMSKLACALHNHYICASERQGHKIKCMLNGVHTQLC